jgi:hypothetical protein
MLKIGSLGIDAIKFGERSISQVYLGVNKVGVLIWEAVRSCFGAGYWINNYPWKNTDAWKN